MAVSFSELEELRPVTRLDDFLGKEHFRVYGDEIGITHRLSGLLFKTLVCPDGFKYSYRNRRQIDHTKYDEVIIKKRWEEGFGYLPALVGNYERTQKVVNQLVIAASSVIFIAENPPMIACRNDVGPDSICALQEMAKFLTTKTMNP